MRCFNSSLSHCLLNTEEEKLFVLNDLYSFIIARAAAVNDPKEFTDKLDEVIHLKINMLKRGLDNGIKQGLFRKMNSTLMTAMLLGLQDYSAYFSKDEDKEHMDSLYEDAKDIILYGILNK